MLSRELEKESHVLAKTAAEIADFIQDAARQTRDIARGLSPVDRDEGGLESALDELAASTSRLTGISCSFAGPSPAQMRDNTQAIHLFRIAQEALANAIKHGKAGAVVIALEADEGTCSLRISDDGIGFARNGSKKKGWG